MTDLENRLESEPTLTEAEIRDIILYVASWNLGFSKNSTINDVCIDPLHIDALIASGHIITSKDDEVFTTEKGDDYITHSLSTKNTFLNRYWRQIDFFQPTGSSPRVFNIAYRGHPDLFVYGQLLPLDVTILHIQADQKITNSLIKFLESRAIKAQAVVVDTNVGENLNVVQNTVDDSLFTLIIMSPDFIQKYRENVVISILLNSILLQKDEFVLPVAFSDSNVPFLFDNIGHIKISSSISETVGKLLEQRLARPPVFFSSPTDPSQFTNEQKCQALLWSLLMYRKVHGSCYVLIENIMLPDWPDNPSKPNILSALADKGLVDTEIWSANVPVARINDIGRQYLRRQLASHKSFIYQAYSDINTKWTEPSSWSLGLEPGTLTVQWKGISIPMSVTTVYEFDVALSFSGKDRNVAKNLAHKFKNRGMRVFYDEYEAADSWGKPIYEYLVDVFRRKACFCVMLISKHYLESKWAVLERRAAQDRDLFTEGEYILPIRLDDTEVPGLLRTIGCLEYSSYTDEEIGNLVARKLKRFASS
ncbi:MAG: hypothetical protein FD178_1479 [Ignavibacteria bacterium]|nr:MAG: hypothetical protein FD178_1479 [Ignavibacteria bacterium]